jgi:hypothetical protein
MEEKEKSQIGWGKARIRKLSKKRKKWSANTNRNLKTEGR